MKPTYDVVEIARQFRYVREARTDEEIQNTGLRVEAIQHWSAGQPRDSWCMEFLWMVFDIAYQGEPPFDRMQACQQLLELAREKGWMILEDPHAGDVVLTVHPDTQHAHHVALITSNDPLTAIAGNTSPSGTSSDGDGVHEHYITAVNKVFVRVPQ
jgi:hypothetical protein